MTKVKEIREVKPPVKFIDNPIDILEKIDKEIQEESIAIEKNLWKLEELRDVIDVLVMDTNEAMESLNSGSDKISEAIDLLSRKK